MNRKVIALVVIGVLLVCAFTIGVSYALWSVTKTQESTNIITTKCFDVSLSGTNEIGLVNKYPIDDADGMAANPYTFTITNTCDTAASYQVNLEALASTTFNLDSIKVAFDNNINLYSSYNNADKFYSDSVASKKLVKGVLNKKGDSATYDLRLWIDYRVGNEEQNKKIDVKVVVTAAPTDGV